MREHVRDILVDLEILGLRQVHSEYIDKINVRPLADHVNGQENEYVDNDDDLYCRGDPGEGL